MLVPYSCVSVTRTKLKKYWAVTSKDIKDKRSTLDFKNRKVV
jgi:hypothetical protein